MSLETQTYELGSFFRVDVEVLAEPVGDIGVPAVPEGQRQCPVCDTPAAAVILKPRLGVPAHEQISETRRILGISGIFYKRDTGAWERLDPFLDLGVLLHPDIDDDAPLEVQVATLQALLAQQKALQQQQSAEVVDGSGAEPE